MTIRAVMDLRVALRRAARIGGHPELAP
jgi:hypothetical protein